MKFRRTSLTIAVSLAVAACGGGSGGGGSGGLSSTLGAFSRSSVPYYTPVSAPAYQTFAGAASGSAVIDIFRQDLNKDNIDEVVIGGRMSQPKTVAEWQQNNLQIYGWNTGSFTNETATWFAGNDNQILGTEPSIKFGDFNGDTNIDMFVAPSTDMAHYGNGIVYFNSGNSRLNRTTLALNNVWGHDSVVKDLNGDGFADILIASLNSGTMSVAYGSAGGTFTTFQAAVGTTGAAGISVADYLGNGGNTMVLTDASATGNQDTKLYSFSTASGNLVLTEVSALPASRFYLPKWDTARAAVNVAPHDIRNITFDFNADNRPDVIVVSTLPSGGSKPYTEIQFLRNDAGGTFTDVTDSVLVGFDNTVSPSYQPQLLDINKDGLIDIVLPAQDSLSGGSTYTAGRVLLASSDGKFVTGYESVFRDFWNQISAATVSANTDWGQSINIVSGPGGDYYLIGTVLYNGGTTTKTAVYAARIGSSGTTSVQATAAAINTMWPFLSGIETNAVLARTASSFINGIALIDWANVWQPVGHLGISLDGRNGSRQHITGSISVPGMDRQLLQKVQALDEVGRNFTVDLSGLTVPTMDLSLQSNSFDHQDSSTNWTSRLLATNYHEKNGFSHSGDGTNNRYAVSFGKQLSGDNDPWTYRFGMARMPGSAWLAFTGVFGHIEHSTMIDVSATRKIHDNWFAQAGAIQTSTAFQKGLVQNITPLYAAYAVAGYRNKKFSVYGGLQPTVFAGALDIKLPISVDKNGKMHYSDYRVNIRTEPVSFMGFERRWNTTKHSYRMSGVMNDRAQFQTKFHYGFNF